MIDIINGVNNIDVFRQLESSVDIHKNAARRSLFYVGQVNKNLSRKKIINPPKTGIHWPGLPNRSSESGQPPATQSGELERHVDYIVYGDNEMEFGDRTQSGKFPYGRHLELVMNRPHIKSTVDETKGLFEKNVRIIVESYLR